MLLNPLGSTNRKLNFIISGNLVTTKFFHRLGWSLILDKVIVYSFQAKKSASGNWSSSRTVMNPAELAGRCTSVVCTASNQAQGWYPGWRLRDIQRWSALIQNTFRSVSALLITWKSLNSADSALNSAENGNFQS